MNKYVPGQCNIGLFEAKRRLKAGIFGLILWASFSFIFLIFFVNEFIAIVVLFATGFTGVLGILQYYNKFCVYYGFLEVFNFNEVISLTKVKTKENIDKDKQKALVIFLISFGVAFVYALLFIILT